MKMSNETLKRIIFTVILLIISAAFVIFLVFIANRTPYDDSDYDDSNVSDYIRHYYSETDTPCHSGVVNNGVESKVAGGTMFEYKIATSEGNHIIYMFSRSVAECYGAVGVDGSLDTGEDFLYVDPKTSGILLGSRLDIEEYQGDGRVCYTADDAWSHINENGCVAFYSQYLSYNDSFYYINERKDYWNGFSVVIPRDSSISWDDIVKKYSGKIIAVRGRIEQYKDRPEIKIRNSQQIQVWPEFFGVSTKRGIVFKSF